MFPPHRTWTGGHHVEMPQLVPHARALYREQLRTFRSFWGVLPDDDTCEIFKSRARADAYASWREYHYNRSTK